MQWAASPRSVIFDYVPSLHGNGADAPSGQYEPGAHAWHSVKPDALTPKRITSGQRYSEGTLGAH